jgi:hypothetical protein
MVRVVPVNKRDARADGVMPVDKRDARADGQGGA